MPGVTEGGYTTIGGAMQAPEWAPAPAKAIRGNGDPVRTCSPWGLAPVGCLINLGAHQGGYH